MSGYTDNCAKERNTLNGLTMQLSQALTQASGLRAALRLEIDNIDGVGAEKLSQGSPEPCPDGMLHSACVIVRELRGVLDQIGNEIDRLRTANGMPCGVVANPVEPKQWFDGQLRPR